MNLQQIIVAVGGLGTAAFGLVDACKAVLPINDIGFGRIKKTIQSLTPSKATALSQDDIVGTAHSNWINGTDLSSQKSIAKSLIKLNLNPSNAADLAMTTGLDSTILAKVATSIAAGTPLTSPESDLYGRFDFIVTALLDETYQGADNVYRNWTRGIAVGVAVVLALLGRLTLNPEPGILESVIVGLLATPLAPIAKDLSSALATAVNTMQSVKKAMS